MNRKAPSTPQIFPRALAQQSRRDHLKSLGMLSLMGSGIFSSRAQAAVACTLAPEMTQGPYWVDEKLNRYDITTGTTRTAVLDAIPMTLDIQLYDQSGQACGSNPGRNVQVDIWHCDAAGAYSDASGGGQANTLGQDFLRGYQVSDASGRVSFRTIYPGWYSGRAVHIHLRARLYDASGNTTYNFTTQLFFDDAFSDEVYRTPGPYLAHGTRNTRNSNDVIFRSAAAAPMVSAAYTTNISAPLYGEVAIGLSGLPASTAYEGFTASARNEGSATMPTLVSDLTVASADRGTTGDIYVAAWLGDRWYFNNGSAWVLVQNPIAQGFPAFYRGVLNASHTFTILSGLNTSQLGRVEVYVGYGADNLSLLQNQRFSLVHTLNG